MESFMENEKSDFRRGEKKKNRGVMYALANF